MYEPYEAEYSEAVQNLQEAHRILRRIEPLWIDEEGRCSYPGCDVGQVDPKHHDACPLGHAQAFLDRIESYYGQEAFSA